MAKKLVPKKTILIEADDLIHGARRAEYGPPDECFQNIADQWALFLMQKYGFDIALEPEDVCWMMADFKKVRQIMNKKRDNVRDAAGYLGLIEKLGPLDSIEK